MPLSTRNQKVLAKKYFLFYILSSPYLPKHILFLKHIVRMSSVGWAYTS
jgi:hypothetical protein